MSLFSACLFSFCLAPFISQSKIYLIFLNQPAPILGARIYGNEFMKKNNNKHRNSNYNNQIYSLNYRFDSISCAGKISGTALDLIKKYNELAKEAQGNADYVEAENFRQYAEHYRKIVTEINERRNQQRVPAAKDAENQQQPATTDTTEEAPAAAEEPAVAAAEAAPRREFKIIEIKDSEQPEEATTKPARTRGRRTAKAAEEIAAI